MKIHRDLGHGFLESVYANALAIELNENNIPFQREVPIQVYYKKAIIGEFRADFQIHNNLILELKAIEHLLPVHEMQTVNYLKATHIDIGLLINFGASKLQFKRKYRLPLTTTSTS